jgi:hypothetical protein
MSVFHQHDRLMIDTWTELSCLSSFFSSAYGAFVRFKVRGHAYMDFTM